MDVARVEQLVAGFHDGADGAALKSKELILDLLRHTPQPFSRGQFAPGHITCTGLVLNRALDRVLLVYHRRLNRWLLPGGHVEAEDPDPARAAQREVLEETGAELDPAFQPRLAGLDIHGIPPGRGEPFHQHHDLVFLFRATSDVAVSSPESRAVAWCSVAEFDRYVVPPNVRLAFARSTR
jgi:8-oxo-dGTP pyrophosphatase MutT (NUDIX family)